MNNALRHWCIALALGVALSIAPGQCAAQQVEGLVNLTFQVDVRVFAVMAALNAAGFDLDADSLQQNPARRLVREKLAAAPDELRSRLWKFYESAASGLPAEAAQGRFISYALLLKGPPGFQLPFKAAEVPEDAQPIIGFELLVAELWRAARLDEVWRTVMPHYVAEMEAYRPLLRDLIVDVLRYMRTEARIALDREVTFVPDLLNGYAVINARNIGNTYIVVVGPSRSQDKPLRSLRHEYLHFLVDPLLAKHRAALPAAAPFLDRVEEQRSALPRYRNDFMLMVTESLIRTLELRVEGGSPADMRAGVLRLYDEGLILSPYFSEAFQKFEKGSDALQEFFPGLIQGIQWETESGRADEMEQWGRDINDSSARSVPLTQDATAKLSRLLADANRLLLARQFDAVAPLLDEALALDPNNANALFGMGQVSAQAQQFERALDFYGRAAANASPAESWIAAWSHVRRGSIFSFQDQTGKAREEWNRVLGMSGDLRGALEAARKALEQK